MVHFFENYNITMFPLCWMWFIIEATFIIPLRTTTKLYHYDATTLSLSHTSFFSLLFLIHSYFMVIWNSTIHKKNLLKILASRGGLILTRGGWNFLLKISYLRWIFCLKSLDNNQISQILTKKLCSPALNPLLNEFGDFDGVWGFFTSPPLH